MQEQLASMDQEEGANNFITSSKTNPYVLFNLVSSPLLYTMPLDRKRNAISHSLSGEILEDNFIMIPTTYLFISATRETSCTHATSGC